LQTFPGFCFASASKNDVADVIPLGWGSPLVKLGHNKFGAAGYAGENIDLVHERFHQENAAPGIAEDIFILARVWNILDAKSRTLVDHTDHQFVFQQLEDHVYFSFAALFVAVLKGVHDAFVHCQADFVLIVFAKSGDRGHTHTHFFGKSNALDHRLQNNFEPLRF
jgi:hypothetical protein